MEPATWNVDVIYKYSKFWVLNSACFSILFIQILNFYCISTFSAVRWIFSFVVCSLIPILTVFSFKLVHKIFFLFCRSEYLGIEKFITRSFRSSLFIFWLNSMFHFKYCGSLLTESTVSHGIAIYYIYTIDILICIFWASLLTQLIFYIIESEYRHLE